MQKFGSNAWLMYNYQLEGILKEAQSELKKVSSNILELNKIRKFEQLEKSDTIKRLNAKWYELVGKTHQVKRACDKLEEQVEKKRKIVDDLKQKVQEKEKEKDKKVEQEEEEKREQEERKEQEEKKEGKEEEPEN